MADLRAEEIYCGEWHVIAANSVGRFGITKLDLLGTGRFQVGDRHLPPASSLSVIPSPVNFWLASYKNITRHKSTEKLIRPAKDRSIEAQMIRLPIQSGNNQRPFELFFV
ncbi:hypothetical protein EDD18DRAFT_1108346 [Armillaria luteobubalina]|uniref:Uncharacterized protein n=1 Tax=Armillaria luteobubalina TaxID=153913 RepID=A0AA39PZ01_9AGAR|nr:hypothetical protein EDD18DRAFT_1108346 [Armillaria luteobubalina]